MDDKCKCNKRRTRSSLASLSHAEASPPRRCLIRQLDVPIREIDEMLPRIVAGLAELEMEHGPPLRALRLMEQPQAGLVGRAVALAAVAGHAGADDVFPGAFAAAVARDDVVEIEVLAVVLVPA